eukprot:6559767-Lingulodinium_polyedra.AAC.1
MRVCISKLPSCRDFSNCFEHANAVQNCGFGARFKLLQTAFAKRVRLHFKTAAKRVRMAHFAMPVSTRIRASKLLRTHQRTRLETAIWNCRDARLHKHISH